MTNVAITLVILLLFVVGVVLLQVFLSRRESKWPGLVLPAITLLYSLVMVLNMASFVSMGSPLLAAAGVFLICNIPTFVLLGVYAVCREKYRKHREMKKMSLEDL